MPVRAVVFDVGNTLWFDAVPRPLDEVFALQAARLAPLFARWGIVAPTPLEAIARDVWDAWTEAYRVAEERRTLRDPSVPFVWRGALAVREIDITDEQAVEIWRAAWLPVREFGVQVYPDTLDVLAALRDLGLKVALNTTRPCTADMLAPDLHDFGLAGHIDAVVCSGDTGYFKPHPSTFERALALLGTPPHEAVMVGDGCASDMAGAKPLGMRTVLKRNGLYGAPRCPHADFEIHDLGELLTLPLFGSASTGGATESLIPHEDANADRY